MAISKIAMQVQKEESPVYDNIFTVLGSFQIEMTYFKALVRSYQNQEDHFYFRNVKYLSVIFVRIKLK